MTWNTSYFGIGSFGKCLVTGCWLVGWILVLGQSIEGQQKEYYESYLNRRGIEATPDGIREFAKRLKPDAELRKQIQAYIDQLGSQKFAERQNAFNRLKGYPRSQIGLLKKAAESANPEKRYRAKLLIRFLNEEIGPLLNSVLQVVIKKELKGLLPEVLIIVETNMDPLVFSTAKKAAVATSTEKDLEFLRQYLEHERAEFRLISIDPIAKIEPTKMIQWVQPLLADVDPAVQLQAAKAFANVGDRRCLAVLVDLLKAEKVAHRIHAVYTLQALTKQKFDFYAHDKPGVRAKSLERWQAWVDTKGSDADLTFPINVERSRSNLKDGHMLLAYGHAGRVVELDANGNVVFEYKVKHAWSAEKTAHGNVLIAAYSLGKVIEVNMQGKIVWEFPCQNCLNARPLENGNILAVSHTGHKVMEVTRDKKVVWETRTGGFGCDAHRLENGNTLIAEDRAVRILDRKGKEIWRYAAQHPYGVEPLPNGNILVCDITTNRVMEVNRDKKVVWSYTGVNPCDAYRLPNGNTLITDNRRFVEVTPDKKIVWEKKGARYGTARR